jgi:hypothetical protein
MGGADTESYYFGNMLLEKLRIWNGEKNTEARGKAEKEYVRYHDAGEVTDQTVTDSRTGVHDAIQSIRITRILLVNLCRPTRNWLMWIVVLASRPGRSIRICLESSRGSNSNIC